MKRVSFHERMPMLEPPEPRHMPCADCGASVDVADAAGHVCDPERRLDFDLIRLRGEIAAFDDELDAFLDSPQGRFEVWDAERRRLDGR